MRFGQFLLRQAGWLMKPPAAAEETVPNRENPRGVGTPSFWFRRWEIWLMHYSS